MELAHIATTALGTFIGIVAAYFCIRPAIAKDLRYYRITEKSS